MSIGKRSIMHTPKRDIDTAFVKTPVGGPAIVTRDGVAGDEHVFESHGGHDMAVLVFSKDHYRYWRESGLELPDAAAFGENVTVVGHTEDLVCIGDTFRAGTVVMQVAQPRMPCYKIAARYGYDSLEYDPEHGYGYLMRVLEEGTIEAGDQMMLQARGDHGITVRDVMTICARESKDVDGRRRVAAIPSLAEAFRTRVISALQRLDVSA